MISIIMTVYNGADYLPAAVDSLLSQSFTDWELLLVDDGSNDGITPALTDSYASDERVRVFHTENRGLASARNFALPRIRGEYVAFLDADDILHPQFLKALSNTAAETDADIVFCRFKLFSKEAPFPQKKYPHFTHSVHTPVEVIEKTMYQTGFGNSLSGKIYRSELWKNLRLRDGTYYEDLDIFYHPIYASHKIAMVPVEMYGYRQHPGSYLHVFKSSRLDALDAVDRMEQWTAATIPALLPAARDRRMSAHFNILNLAYRNKAATPELERRCLDVIRQYGPASLRNKKVRIKNRLGGLLSLFPRSVISAILKIF
ncbi:MAG: glycosyltransferase [Candidatus Amulumruptor caecigallinarius]|nr:glycosyltransferase [Candidatus Amulumruptor caecigallinarius]